MWRLLALLSFLFPLSAYFSVREVVPLLRNRRRERRLPQVGRDQHAARSVLPNHPLSLPQLEDEAHAEHGVVEASPEVGVFPLALLQKM